VYTSPCSVRLGLPYSIATQGVTTPVHSFLHQAARYWPLAGLICPTLSAGTFVSRKVRAFRTYLSCNIQYFSLYNPRRKFRWPLSSCSYRAVQRFSADCSCCFPLPSGRFCRQRNAGLQHPRYGYPHIRGGIALSYPTIYRTPDLHIPVLQKPCLNSSRGSRRRFYLAFSALLSHLLSTQGRCIYLERPKGGTCKSLSLAVIRCMRA